MAAPFPAERRIFAVIPSTEDLQLVFDGNSLPTGLWHPGEGTWENTLAEIGQRVVGRSVSADWAHNSPAGTIYITRSVAPGDVRFGDQVSWRALPSSGETSHLGRRRYLQELIADAAKGWLEIVNSSPIAPVISIDKFRT